MHRSQLLEELTNKLEFVLVGYIEEVQYPDQRNWKLCGLGFCEIASERLGLAEFLKFQQCQLLVVSIQQTELCGVEEH